MICTYLSSDYVPVLVDAFFVGPTKQISNIKGLLRKFSSGMVYNLKGESHCNCLL